MQKPRTNIFILKEQSSIFHWLIIATDVLLMTATFPLAFYLRFDRNLNPPEYLKFGWIVAPFVIISLFKLYRNKIYHQLRFFSFYELSKKILWSFAVSSAVSAALLFLSHATFYSRLVFITYSLSSLALILLFKVGLKLLFNYCRLKGYNLRQVIVVGSGIKLSMIKEFLQRKKSYGINVVAAHELTNLSEAQFEELLTTNIVDEVYFACDRQTSRSRFSIDNYLDIAEQAGKTCKILLNINEKRHSSCSFGRLGDFPIVVLYPVTLDQDQLLLKRLLDLAGASVGLLLNVVIFPFVALAIKLESPGPVFFAQQRVGKNGRHFTLYKFRSMYRNAEAQKKELADRNEMNGAVFKITNDPRVTRVGSWLRKLSIDEVPQFWNVMKGDMSLVGTRPPTPSEVAEYQLQHYRRLSIKPGLTGMWQVSGRNRITDFDQIVALDTKYIDQWSLFLDCKIILKTAIVLGSGK